MITGFSLGLARGGCDQVDPWGLLGRVFIKAPVKVKGKKVFVKVIESG
jgi:hypothetical protein